MIVAAAIGPLPRARGGGPENASSADSADLKQSNPRGRSFVLPLVMSADSLLSGKFEIREAVSQPRIMPKGKAQADSNAQQPPQDVSIARGRQSRHGGTTGCRAGLWNHFYGRFGYGMTNTGQDAWLMTCSVIVPVTKSLMLFLPSVQMTIRSMPSFSASSTMTLSGLPSRST